MICIDAENLRDGLYNIKDGKIYKYKAKGGTVRAHELRDIVTCGDCKYDGTWKCPWRNTQVPRYPSADDFCSYGERSSE